MEITNHYMDALERFAFLLADIREWHPNMSDTGIEVHPYWMELERELEVCVSVSEVEWFNKTHWHGIC